MALQPRAERLPALFFHRPRQPRAVKRIAWQRLGLLIVNALQQVFETPQEKIGVPQAGGIVRREQMQLLYRLKRRQQRALL